LNNEIPDLSFYIIIRFSVFPQTNTDTSQIVASIGNEKIHFGTYLARYEDYLIYSGLQDNQQARFAILNNMISEILLKTYDDNSAIYNNPEYNKEIEWPERMLLWLILRIGRFMPILLPLRMN